MTRWARGVMNSKCRNSYVPNRHLDQLMPNVGRASDKEPLGLHLVLADRGQTGGMVTRSDNNNPGASRLWPAHQYAEPPFDLVAFPDASQVKPKGGRRRWRDRRGRIYEWDSRHGTIEICAALGRHLGEFDHMTGDQLKSPDRTRRIDP